MDRKRLSLLALPLLILATGAAPALAWTSDSGGPSAFTSTQLTDPDESVENFAAPAAGGQTEIELRTQGDGSAKPATPAAPTPADAEPVNPSWPMWMVWHAQ
jgi:hypothetical protein